MLDLWSFVDLPPGTATRRSTGGGDSVTQFLETPVSVGPLNPATGGVTPELVGTLVVVTLVWTVFRASLTAGYLGSLQEYRTTGTYSFVSNVVDYVGPLFLLNIVTAGTILVGGLLFLSSPAFLVLFLPFFLIGSYLFYGTPFLFVVTDCSFLEGIRGSVRLATGDGEYFRWGCLYFVFFLPCSFVASLVVINLGAIGILVGLVALPPVGMALTMATLSVFDDRLAERTDFHNPPRTRRYEDARTDPR
jgi:hypothetical protein